jgi:hypothetical protein
MASSLLQVVNSLFQTCYNKLGTSSANTTCWQLVNRLVTTCLQTCNNLCVFMCVTSAKTTCWRLVDKLVTRCEIFACVASLLTSCDINLLTICWNSIVTVTMLFQQLVNKMCLQQVCSKLVNKLWQCCSNNLSTICVRNRLVASLLTSCDN